ncbi:expressed unknown protein [Seminavis robusta]|uniref:Uncharacterized protein n=1 Tax=Seminavis robusta TaxID=568900 RepID=A0A9N8E6G0_9STRA|nr:expressed unknown protein [Seminavis robusta]|eukprot:Sro601_g173450.1 n/a (172) ;mRNA; f:7263-7866
MMALNNRKRMSTDGMFDMTLASPNKKPALSPWDEPSLFDMLSEGLNIEESQRTGLDFPTSKPDIVPLLDTPFEALRAKNPMVKHQDNYPQEGWKTKLQQKELGAHTSRVLGTLSAAIPISPAGPTPVTPPTQPPKETSRQFLYKHVPSAADLIDTLATDDDVVFGIPFRAF